MFYKTGENMTQLHWFVKIPRSLQTVAMDERELVMYNTIFPRLKTFIKENLKPGWRDRMCQNILLTSTLFRRRKAEPADSYHLFLQFYGGWN